MAKEYRTIQEVAGPLMLVKDVENVKYDELGEIELSSGEKRRCKVLEIDGSNALVQLFERLCVECSNFYEDSLRSSKTNIGTAYCIRITRESYPAVRDLSYIIAKIYYFFFEYRLQAKVARGYQFHLFHTKLVYQKEKSVSIRYAS